MPRRKDKEEPAVLADEDQLQDAEWAARLLKVSKHQIYRLAHAGVLEKVMVGHLLRVTERSVRSLRRRQ